MQCPARAWAKAQGGREMLDCEIGLPGPQPEPAAPTPTVGKARIERESTVDQRDSRIDVFTKRPEYEGDMSENAGIVSSKLNGLPREIDALAPICLAVLHPVKAVDTVVAMGRQGESWTVERV